MKQPGALIILFIFVAAVSFSLASEQYNSGRKLKATLTGNAEVPGPGDSDGTGTFTATLNAGKNQVCYELAVSNVGSATAAHIHTGEAGKAGPVLLTLTPPANSSSKDCATLEARQDHGHLEESGELLRECSQRRISGWCGEGSVD